MDTEQVISLLPLLLEGKATKAQEKEVFLWLGESEEHMGIYKNFCTTYYRLHYAHRWERIDTVAALSEVKKELTKKQKASVIIRRWMSVTAALFFLSVGITILMWKEEPLHRERELVKDIQSGEKKAVLTLANGSQVELTAENRINIDMGGVRAVEDSAVGLVYHPIDMVAEVLEYHQLNVPRAGEYIMTLSDGTKVWLNAETEIRYPVIFGAEKREVFITGEAFFEVVKDAARPFIVHTPHTHTTVLGTSFNVMAYAGDLQTEITLVSGQVNVEAGKNSSRITPGHQIQVDNTTLKMESREVNTAFYTSWKDGLFDFDRMTLDQLCVQLSRWYDVDFFFANRTAAEKRFTGAVKRNNTLRFMLDFVEKTSDVRFEVNGKMVSVYNQ